MNYCNKYLKNAIFTEMHTELTKVITYRRISALTFMSVSTRSVASAASMVCV